MFPTTVEEIFAAAQRLPNKERQRLSELLQHDTTPANPTSLPKTITHEFAENRATASIRGSNAAEMQWLLDHPDFWEQHRGEHVALKTYEMIAAGKTRKEVLAEARRRGIPSPFVQYLPKCEEEWLLGFSNQPVAEQ